MTSSAIGGASKTYAYDVTGNITSKSDIGTFSYPAAGSARPHGVSSIVGTVNNGNGGSFPNPSYSYDANGNLTSGGGRSLTYSSFNIPSTVTSVSVS
jgi:hypothetical protein